MNDDIPVVDEWTMREAVIRAGLGNAAEAQSIPHGDLEDLWIALWLEQRRVCWESMA